MNLYYLINPLNPPLMASIHLLLVLQRVTRELKMGSRMSVLTVMLSFLVVITWSSIWYLFIKFSPQGWKFSSVISISAILLLVVEWCLLGTITLSLSKLGGALRNLPVLFVMSSFSTQVLWKGICNVKSTLTDNFCLVCQCLSLMDVVYSTII